MIKKRCPWLTHKGIPPDEYIHYHDTEWGVLVRDDKTLFELLILEGAQAGLSWLTILKKRDHYRKAYDNFDPIKIVEYTEIQQHSLLENRDIVRNRLKIAVSIINAQAFLAVQQAFVDFSSYLWRFVGGKTLQNHWLSSQKIPVTTPISDAMSKDLKQGDLSLSVPQSAML